MILPYQSPRHAKPKWRRKAALVLCVLGFLAACFLWIAHSGMYYRTVRGPYLTLELPYCQLDALSVGNGFHFRIWPDASMRWPKLRFPDFRGMMTYHHGYHAEFLGMVAALSPRGYSGGDYFVSPYAALVVPYWLVIMGLGWLSLKLSGAWAALAPCRNWSSCCWVVATALTLGFIGLNLVPHDIGTPTRSLPPETIWDWLDVTFYPPGTYGDVRLSYGVPFTFLRQGFIDGKVVGDYHGARVGWETYKLAENICALVLGVWAVNLVLGAIRIHRAGRDRQQGRVPAPRMPSPWPTVS